MVERCWTGVSAFPPLSTLSSIKSPPTVFSVKHIKRHLWYPHSEDQGWELIHLLFSIHAFPMTAGRSYYSVSDLSSADPGFRPHWPDGRLCDGFIFQAALGPIIWPLTPCSNFTSSLPCSFATVCLLFCLAHFCTSRLLFWTCYCVKAQEDSFTGSSAERFRGGVGWDPSEPPTLHLGS